MSFRKFLFAAILICSALVGHSVAQAPSQPETAEMGAPAETPSPSNTNANLCRSNNEHPGNTAYSDICKKLSPLLGEWASPEFGGTIEFVLLPDKTVSLYIRKASERMLQQGYSRDMLIARAWEYGGTDSGTWKLFARNGEVLSAKFPGRDAGAIFGTASWVKSGIIHIHRDRPGVLNLPAQLEGRISDYKAWVRPASIAPSPRNPQTNTEICPVISNPVCGVKTGAPKMFANICDVEKSGFRAVHISQCQTREGAVPTSPDFSFQCTHVAKPICAIDLEGIKRTFTNACEAGKDNHSVLYEGNCKPGSILGADANSIICPATAKPVCAKKNSQTRTFKNACGAEQAKFEILSQGPCR